MTKDIPTFGSKAQVFHMHAKKTKGGLTKKDLVKNKHGRIVSRKQMQSGKKAIKRLFSLGFKPKKGTFKLFHKGTAKSTKSHAKKTKRTTRRRRGGAVSGMPMYGINKDQGSMAPVAFQAGKV
jgi:hypothetical protein